MKKKQKHIIARTVRAEAIRNGVSAPELAAKCGLSQRTYERRMANPEEMSLKEMWLLEKVLGLKKGELASL